MSHFYKELKDLRLSKKISLEEISERTKINVEYLKNIELGDFLNIDQPYLRLFLRAYAEEIGSDSKRALEQLDSFLGNEPLIPKDKNNQSILNDKKINQKKTISNKQLRNEFLIAGFFSIVFIFSIFIFQKIFNQKSNAIGSKSGPIIIKEITPLTHDELIKDYVKDHSSQELLPVSPPFFIKIKTINQIAYTFKNDTLPSISNILNPNRELDLNAFIEKSEIVFNSTKGLNFFVNASELKQISGYPYPVRLIFEPNPPSIAIERYKPIF